MTFSMISWNWSVKFMQKINLVLFLVCNILGSKTWKIFYFKGKQEINLWGISWCFQIKFGRRLVPSIKFLSLPEHAVYMFSSFVVLFYLLFVFILFFVKVMLVFSKEDTQSDGFQTACEKGGYKCSLFRNPGDALECYLEEQHDVIIIDHRNPKTIDAIALCR